MAKTKKSAARAGTEALAVAYYRYSDHKQTEQSIEGQRREVERFAALRGITILREYVDRDISGRRDDRPQLQHLLADAVRGEWSIVLVYSFDRFARNRFFSAVNKNYLQSHGVRVVSASEVVPDTPEGVLVESLFEGMAEYYSLELGRKTLRGMMESAYKGTSVGGILPVGYCVDPDTLTYRLDDDAPLVRELFERYARGDAVAEILSWAASVGLHTRSTRKAPGGRPLSASTLAHMMQNQKYTGTLTFGGKDFPGVLPPIVDDDLFQACAWRLDGRRHIMRSSKATSEYLLTAKLVCGKCGAFYFGDSGTSSTGAVHRYYTCQTRRSKGKSGCDARVWRKDVLERGLVNYTMREVLTPENIRYIGRLAEDAHANREADALLDGLQRQLAETRVSMDNLLSAIEQGAYSPKIQKRLQELEALEASLQEQIADCVVSDDSISARAVEYYLSQFAEGDADDPDHQRRIIDVLINNVAVHDDRFVIAYNYKNGARRLQVDDLLSLAAVSAPSVRSDGLVDGSPCEIHPNYAFYAGCIVLSVPADILAA